MKTAASAISLTSHAAKKGNFRRAVARMAKLMGISAQIYVLEFMVEETKALIRSEGAEVITVHGDYNVAVRAAAKDAETCG